MPPKAPEASGGGSAAQRPYGQPNEAQQRGAEPRQAMLLACGELGYRAQFYRYFDGLGACYTAAYEAETARLYEQVLATSSPVLLAPRPAGST